MKRSAILVIVVLLVNACSSPKTDAFDVSAEEKIWLEKFFRYFLFYENAIYTLAGSKPMTELSLFYYDISQEDLREKYRSERVWFDLNCDDPKDMAFYKQMSSEEKEKAILIRDKDYIYNFEELWDRWEKIQDRFAIKNKFLLIKKKRSETLISRWKAHEPECSAIYDILFVDIAKTAFVIQENYDLFKQVIGGDFDPLKLVFDLKNENSEFWNKISGSPTYSYLWGLLYGFGKENAFYHYWKSRYMRGEPYTEEKPFSDSVSKQPFRLRPLMDERNAYSISKFSIPAFVSFSEEDQIVEKYKREQEKIRKLYRGKDFVLFTLELLTEPKT